MIQEHTLTCLKTSQERAPINLLLILAGRESTGRGWERHEGRWLIEAFPCQILQVRGDGRYLSTNQGRLSGR